jgi:hypothetical protein
MIVGIICNLCYDFPCFLLIKRTIIKYKTLGKTSTKNIIGVVSCMQWHRPTYQIVSDHKTWHGTYCVSSQTLYRCISHNCNARASSAYRYTPRENSVGSVESLTQLSLATFIHRASASTSVYRTVRALLPCCSDGDLMIFTNICMQGTKIGNI